MRSRACMTLVRSSSESERQSLSTRSAKRKRSFHKVFHQEHRAARHFLFRRRDLLAQRPVSRDLDRFAQREVFVIRDEDGYLAAVAREDGPLAGDLAVAHKVARLAGEIEDLDAAFHHCRPSRYARNAPPSAGCLSA